MIGNEFVCKDRNGVVVNCSRECWKKHILSSRSELSGRQELVKEIIESPTSEYQDIRHIDTKSIYKKVVLNPVWEEVLVKVSVKYKVQFGRERGYVKTAYSTDKVKTGEVWLWGQRLS